ncbi:hypothetical protein SeMB42_g04385 [Synchytrium endobioticum]|uniref:Uncharacterized protein n=1 Tax=Synchytrium endobioticum TaxID=286115 RepID=A0A507CYR3_9FUNG|nr:hypothetical protein SeMB42_g04385 [Synchytrium endobioticum]
MTDWVNEYIGKGKPRPTSLFVIGDTRLGKALWARSLGHHMYFCNLFNMDMWDETAFRFDDGSVTTLVGIAGCIINYNEAPIISQYGVTTLTLGIPEERYDQIAKVLLDSHSLRLHKESEANRSGYIWIEGQSQT